MAARGFGGGRALLLLLDGTFFCGEGASSLGVQDRERTEAKGYRALETFILGATLKIPPFQKKGKRKRIITGLTDVGPVIARRRLLGAALSHRCWLSAAGMVSRSDPTDPAARLHFLPSLRFYLYSPNKRPEEYRLSDWREKRNK